MDLRVDELESELSLVKEEVRFLRAELARLLRVVEDNSSASKGAGIGGKSVAASLDGYSLIGGSSKLRQLLLLLDCRKALHLVRSLLGLSVRLWPGKLVCGCNVAFGVKTEGHLIVIECLLQILCGLCFGTLRGTSTHRLWCATGSPSASEWSSVVQPVVTPSS